MGHISGHIDDEDELQKLLEYFPSNMIDSWTLSYMIATILGENSFWSSMVPSADQQLHSSARLPVPVVNMTLNSLNQEVGACPAGSGSLLMSQSPLKMGPLPADPFQTPIFIGDHVNGGSTQVCKIEDSSFEIGPWQSDEEKELINLFPDLGNLTMYDPSQGVSGHDTAIDHSLLHFPMFPNLEEETDLLQEIANMSPENFPNSLNSTAPVTTRLISENASTTLRADLPALSNSLPPRVISTAPRVQAIGRKKIDMKAQKYVTAENSSDSDESDSSSSESEDSNSSSCDSIDVVTVEQENTTVHLSAKSDARLNPVFSKCLRKETEELSLPSKQFPKSKNEVNDTSGRRNCRSNKENDVSIAKSKGPVKHSVAQNGTFTRSTSLTEQQSKDSTKQLTNNNLSEPSEIVRQPIASARNMSSSSSSAVSLKPVQLQPVPTKNLSSTSSFNPLKTVRQPTALVKKAKTNKPIILLEPPKMDPAAKKGRRTRSCQTTRKNEPSTKTISSEVTKQKVSDEKKSSDTKSSPPSSMSLISTQEQSSASSSQISQQSALELPSRTLKLVDIPDLLNTPDDACKITGTPARKRKRFDQCLIREANINAADGGKKTILVFDGVTSNEPAKHVAPVKAIPYAVSAKTVAFATDTLDRKLLTTIAHDHSYHSSRHIQSHIQTPQRMKVMIPPISTQTSIRHQLGNLTKTADNTISNSHIPQRTKEIVVPGSTQPVGEKLGHLTNRNDTTSAKPYNNGVQKKKLSVKEYHKRLGNVQKINVADESQVQSVKTEQYTQAAPSQQEMLSGILAANQQESSNPVERAVEIPDKVVLQPILLAKKEDVVRVRTIRPPPDIITVHTVNRGTNTDTEIDDQLIATLQQSNARHKLIDNPNNMFNQLLAKSMESAKPPTQQVESRASDDFECKTIRHISKKDMSRIKTRSIGVQTVVHFGTSSGFSGSASESSVRSPSPTSSHYSLQSYHDASNSSVGDSRCSRSRSYTSSPDIMGGWSPHSSSSSHSSRFSSSSSRAKRKRDDSEHGEDGMNRKVLFVGGLKNNETKDYLRKLFGRFGTIIDIRIRPRKDRSDEIAFLTFTNNDSCWQAKEEIGADPNLNYEVGFGGRRNFCDSVYEDLDDEHSFMETRNEPKETYAEELANLMALLKKTKKT